MIRFKICKFHTKERFNKLRTMRMNKNKKLKVNGSKSTI